ncbi:MAG TPA: hypothetical protein VJB08_07075 [Candidatus Nanoarchaeia archaeon]|nr:hypothetical protein [Candidatus Nanoarchaeia archaeon]
MMISLSGIPMIAPTTIIEIPDFTSILETPQRPRNNLRSGNAEK